MFASGDSFDTIHSLYEHPLLSDKASLRQLDKLAHTTLNRLDLENSLSDLIATFLQSPGEWFKIGEKLSNALE